MFIRNVFMIKIGNKTEVYIFSSTVDKDYFNTNKTGHK